MLARFASKVKGESMAQGNGPLLHAPPGRWFLVGLGTNMAFQGLEGPALLAQALDALRGAGFALHTRSSFWQSAAWPDPAEPPYINAVALADAGLASAGEVLATMLAIEAQFGRVRRARWAARSLDLDLLDFGGHISEEPGISLPHPRMATRNFVLAPLEEIAPWWHHPILQESAQALLRRAPAGALTQLRD